MSATLGIKQADSTLIVIFRQDEYGIKRFNVSFSNSSYANIDIIALTQGNTKHSVLSRPINLSDYNTDNTKVQLGVIIGKNKNNIVSFTLRDENTNTVYAKEIVDMNTLPIDFDAEQHGHTSSSKNDDGGVEEMRTLLSKNNPQPKDRGVKEMEALLRSSGSMDEYTDEEENAQREGQREDSPEVAEPAGIESEAESAAESAGDAALDALLGGNMDETAGIGSEAGSTPESAGDAALDALLGGNMDESAGIGSEAESAPERAGDAALDALLGGNMDETAGIGSSEAESAAESAGDAALDALLGGNMDETAGIGSSEAGGTPESAGDAALDALLGGNMDESAGIGSEAGSIPESAGDAALDALLGGNMDETAGIGSEAGSIPESEGDAGLDDLLAGGEAAERIESEVQETADLDALLGGNMDESAGIGSEAESTPESAGDAGLDDLLAGGEAAGTESKRRSTGDEIVGLDALLGGNMDESAGIGSEAGSIPESAGDAALDALLGGNMDETAGIGSEAGSTPESAGDAGLDDLLAGSEAAERIESEVQETADLDELLGGNMDEPAGIGSEAGSIPESEGDAGLDELLAGSEAAGTESKRRSTGDEIVGLDALLGGNKGKTARTESSAGNAGDAALDDLLTGNIGDAEEDLALSPKKSHVRKIRKIINNPVFGMTFMGRTMSLLALITVFLFVLIAIGYVIFYMQTMTSLDEFFLDPFAPLRVNKETIEILSP